MASFLPSFDSQNLPDIADSPHQPGLGYKFPKRSFGKKTVVARCFQPTWFQQWPFLHYDETNDLVYCHTCVTSYKQKKMRTSKADPAFVSAFGILVQLGHTSLLLFCNVRCAKDTLTVKMPQLSFKKHAISGCHRESVEMIINLPASTTHIGVQLSQQFAKEIEDNGKMLIKILSCIRYLGRQGLALRGDGNESDGNLIQLLKLEGDQFTLDWLQRKCNKYTSHEIQNELLKFMALHVLRNIGKNLQASSFLTIMIDETTDITNHEQVAVILRRVNEKLEVFEEFIGLYQVDSIRAECLTSVIKDSMFRLNLPISKLRGQCYDGCSTMSGAKTGVAKRIADEEPRAVFSHCYGHSLNLAASDTVKRSKLMNNCLSTTHEITKLIKLSPRRDVIFQHLKAESEFVSNSHTAGLRLLCPTRWTVRAGSHLSIIKNYSVLLDTWDEALEATKETEAKARIHGVCAQMRTFQFLFGTVLGEMILRHTDNLSQTLQNDHISAAEGQVVASMVVNTLESLRNDQHFDLFWLKVFQLVKEYDVNQPQLPHKHKRPRRYDDG